MRALVTGIHGFAAGHLVEHLLAAGDEVLGTARQAATPSPGCEAISTIVWDLAAPLAPHARQAIEAYAPHCVYHLAALSVPSQCGALEPNRDAVAANVEGTRRVVELCKSLARAPRLLFVSSSKVYAPVEVARLVDETAPLGPTSGYGKSKLAAEHIVHAAIKQGLDAVIARPFQHAGPRQKPPLMLAEWVQQFAGANAPVHVQRLNAYLDFSDVRDVVRAYRLIVEAGKSGAVYNVGSGRALRSGQLLEELRRIADPSRPIVEENSQPQYHPLANTNSLRVATGWQPTIDWRQTMADTWTYLQQPLSIGERRNCK